MPPPARPIEIRPAPASIAFSTSSFKALAGRSTTSPAGDPVNKMFGESPY
jgi:hypothetical protein